MNATTFRTEIKLVPATPISHHDFILTTGSCFADEFGGWLTDYKFNTLVNPFGTTYNPLSIHENLNHALDGFIRSDGYVEHHGIWHHFDYHSRWSSANRSQLLDSLIEMQLQVKKFLEKTSVLIITYGTAWVYEHKEQHNIVSNCHKLPAQHFTKRLLEVNEITESLSLTLQRLNNLNPNIRVILTVSPVRHLKDTIELNSVSKAVLRLACHEAATTLNQVDYFPSFEIMMDDLRDYRFYERDKIHPTGEAVDYISHKFSEKYFTAETRKFIEKWDTIRKGVQHRAYHPDSPAHQYFLKDLLHKLTELESFVNVEQEIAAIKSQLHNHA